MREYGFMKAANYQDHDGVVEAWEIEELITTAVRKQQRYIDLADHLSDEDKADLFERVLRQVEWMLSESILIQDCVTDVLDEMIGEQEGQE